MIINLQYTSHIMMYRRREEEARIALNSIEFMSHQKKIWTSFFFSRQSTKLQKFLAGTVSTVDRFVSIWFELVIHTKNYNTIYCIWNTFLWYYSVWVLSLMMMSMLTFRNFTFHDSDNDSWNPFCIFLWCVKYYKVLKSAICRRRVVIIYLLFYCR